MELFRRRSKGHVRQAVVYVARSGASALVVSQHENGSGGVLLEDDEVVTLAGFEDPFVISDTVLAALDRSSVRPERNLGDRKKSAWPAFRASGVRSMRKFEAEFIRIQVSGANEMNITLRIEGAPEPEPLLTVSCAVAPLSPELGERCIDVWNACRDRRF